MFHLAVLSDEIALPPHALKPGGHIAAMKRVIEEKYVDRVVPELGLVVALYDILNVKDSFIFPGDFRDSKGEAASTATFRLAVFRPDVGELLRGKIIESTTTGIRVSIAFFNDVEIPAHELMQPSFFDARNKVWVWQHQEDQLFPYDLGSELLFKVKSVSLGAESSLGDKRLAINRQSATMKSAMAVESAQTGPGPGPDSSGAHNQHQPPMLLIGTVNESGLGPLLWWTDAQ